VEKESALMIKGAWLLEYHLFSLFA